MVLREFFRCQLYFVFFCIQTELILVGTQRLQPWTNLDDLRAYLDYPANGSKWRFRFPLAVFDLHHFAVELGQSGLPTETFEGLDDRFKLFHGESFTTVSVHHR
jgi:hypothetical protein